MIPEPLIYTYYVIVCFPLGNTYHDFAKTVQCKLKLLGRRFVIKGDIFYFFGITRLIIHNIDHLQHYYTISPVFSSTIRRICRAIVLAPASTSAVGLSFLRSPIS